VHEENERGEIVRERERARERERERERESERESESEREGERERERERERGRAERRRHCIVFSTKLCIHVLVLLSFLLLLLLSSLRILLTNGATFICGPYVNVIITSLRMYCVVARDEPPFTTEVRNGFIISVDVCATRLVTRLADGSIN